MVPSWFQCSAPSTHNRRLSLSSSPSQQHPLHALTDIAKNKNRRRVNYGKRILCTRNWDIFSFIPYHSRNRLLWVTSTPRRRYKIRDRFLEKSFDWLWHISNISAHREFFFVIGHKAANIKTGKSLLIRDGKLTDVLPWRYKHPAQRRIFPRDRGILISASWNTKLKEG